MVLKSGKKILKILFSLHRFRIKIIELAIWKHMIIGKKLQLENRTSAIIVVQFHGILCNSMHIFCTLLWKSIYSACSFLMCFFKFSARENDLQQVPHLWSLWPSWTVWICPFKCCDWENDLPYHKIHICDLCGLHELFGYASSKYLCRKMI